MMTLLGFLVAIAVVAAVVGLVVWIAKKGIGAFRSPTLAILGAVGLVLATLWLSGYWDNRPSSVTPTLPFGVTREYILQADEEKDLDDLPLMQGDVVEVDSTESFFAVGPKDRFLRPAGRSSLTVYDRYPGPMRVQGIYNDTRLRVVVRR